MTKRQKPLWLDKDKNTGKDKEKKAAPFAKKKTVVKKGGKK